MPQPRIAVIFESDSDWPVLENCVERLWVLGETPHVEIMSANRIPKRVPEFAGDAQQ